MIVYDYIWYLNIVVTRMKNEDPQKVYSGWQKIGSGSFGVVYILIL